MNNGNNALPNNNNNNEEISIRPYEDGVEIRFSHAHLPQKQFDALMTSLRLNKQAGNIKILSLHIDKDNLFTIHVGGIEGYVNQFIQTIQSELFAATLFPPVKDSLYEKIMRELNY